jgi:hypothetical protein
MSEPALAGLLTMPEHSLAGVKQAPLGYRWPLGGEGILKRGAPLFTLINLSVEFDHPSSLHIWANNQPQDRVDRFFLVHDTKTGKNVPNEYKMYQMAIKYRQSPLNIPNCHISTFLCLNRCRYINNFKDKAIQNLPKLGFWLWKQTIWQPCLRSQL